MEVSDPEAQVLYAARLPVTASRRSSSRPSSFAIRSRNLPDLLPRLLALGADALAKLVALGVDALAEFLALGVDSVVDVLAEQPHLAAQAPDSQCGGASTST